MISAWNELKEMDFYKYFSEIALIPRGSGNEAAISNYVIDFAKGHHLDWERDEKDNVIIRKPGQGIGERCEPLVAQCHMDMVCEKAPESNHDFLTDPIRIAEREGFIVAEDTSLGADNAVGMSYILSILADRDISHPPLEALFTTSEEVGMEGMAKLSGDWVTGSRMLNLDGEEEGILYTSCAGGVRYYLEADAVRVPLKEDAIGYQLSIGGLCGGHSGLDIDKGRGNGILLLARMIAMLVEKENVVVSSFEGGGKTNAIPRDASAAVWFQPEQEARIAAEVERYYGVLSSEYDGIEPDVQVGFERLSLTADQAKGLDKKTTAAILDCILLLPNGVMSYSAHLAGVVEASVNLGSVSLTEDIFCAAGLIRTNHNSKMDDILLRVKLLADRLNCRLEERNRYPAWEYKTHSPLRELCLATYQEIYGRDAELASIHGGLECALMFEKKTDMDMISMGPNLYDVHTINEKADIASIIRVWNYLVKLLEDICR